jgi:hypothetical protein
MFYGLNASILKFGASVLYDPGPGVLEKTIYASRGKLLVNRFGEFLKMLDMRSFYMLFLV